jgi:hypothetical protein
MPAFAGEGKFSALMFGDAYWMAANHDSTLKDMNGLWIRRFFLTNGRLVCVPRPTCPGTSRPRAPSRCS